MRIVSYIFSIFFFFCIAGLVVFYVGRELMLWWAVYSFKTSLRTLQLASQGGYDGQCQQRLGTTGLTATLQLRFLTSKQYVVEAACEQFVNAPILISTGELSPFITKRPGASGVILGADSSMVELVIFEQEARAVQKMLPLSPGFIERSKLVGLENLQIVSRSPRTGEVVATGPVTSCQGYGYYCCNESSEKGMGEQISGLQDCKDTCFSACVNRPVILSFTTNPVLDMRSRQVVISSGGGVEFTYISDGDETDGIQAVLDFGDGTQPGAINGAGGSLSHLYNCFNRPCTYVAKLKLIDKWNIESFASPVSTVTVNVQ